MARPTRKNRKTKKVLSIPELRKAFEHIESVAYGVKKLPKEEQIATFKKEWLKTFGREVETKAVVSYLAVKLGKTRRNRKQKGGMAPLDYQTRPGIDGVYGNFQAYLDRGLIPYPEQGIRQECGVKDFTPHLPAGMGSNQAGGATLHDFTSALTFKPFDSSIPPTFYQNARASLLGMPAPVTGAVEDRAWQYK
jgi:hypothetical protein